MCRHLAYLGRPRALHEVLCDPPHSLLRQSWAPRRQQHGTVNADGFGVGWYAAGDPVPARYRSDRPIWNDVSFPDLARVIRTGALLAAVRDATPGMPLGDQAAAPFAHGRYLFSHNGALGGWPASANKLVADLAPDMTPADLVGLKVLTDSTLLWALLRRRIDAGVPVLEAVRTVVDRVSTVAGGRLNLLVTDGVSIVATACGDTLSWRHDDDCVVVASEPHDDTPGWHDVPDGSIVLATAEGVDVTRLCPP